MSDAVDVQVENHGSIIIFQPLTARARAWLEEHTDGMWWAGGLAVEPRYAPDLAQGLDDDGFVVDPRPVQAGTR